jgi:hypothetical protein
VTAPNGRDYSLMQFNFPLFWGLAIQSYEATLVSDEAPLDRFLDGEDGALSALAQEGLGVFTGKGKCASCHGGPAFTNATVSAVRAGGATATDGGRAHDRGFFNIGVRPTVEDPGSGGRDPFGAPLAIAGRGRAVAGSFKTPTLRNVDLTAPYFHNGGQLSLRQVVEFYSRGGDFTNAEISGRIGRLALDARDVDGLVAFLRSLTDPRVRDQAAPFDHPQLFVPMGAQPGTAGELADCFREVPATGAAGGAPLPRFPGFSGPPCDAVPDLVRSAAAPTGTAPPAEAEPAATALAPRAPARAACVVPRVTRLTVAQARRRLRRAGCALGHIARARRGRGRLVVLRQRPAAGIRRPGGWGVAVRLRHAR